MGYEEIKAAFDSKEDALLESYSLDARTFLKKVNSYSPVDIHFTEVGKKLYAFLKDTGNKPSLFFKEHKNDFKGWIKEDLLEDFYTSVDEVIYFQNRMGLYRRCLRDKKYENNLDVIGQVIKCYHRDSILDKDLHSQITGNLSEDEKDYLRHRGWMFSPYLIAAELDRGNRELHDFLERQIYEDNSHLDMDMITGIIRSKDTGLYESLGKLLLAAKLQEGLRQSICESMDCGRIEAFNYLLKVVLDNNLMRFSSVVRAAATWIGLGAGYSEIQRINNKQLALLQLYMNNEDERKKALSTSEDSMEIYMALWVKGAHDANDSFAEAKEILKSGTAHQMLVAMFYLKAMKAANDILAEAVKLHNDNMQLMAMVLPQLRDIAWERIKDAYPKLYDYISKTRIQEPIPRIIPEFEERLGDKAGYEELFDSLKELLQNIPKKELVFDPCVFPWHSEKLFANDVMTTMAYISSAIGDEKRMDDTLRCLDKAEQRYHLLVLLASEPDRLVQKETIRAMTTNSDSWARSAAFNLLKFMDLEKEDYDKFEDSLRLKRADIRTGAIENLCRLKGAKLEERLQRLLTASSLEKRLGALEIISLIKKDENRQEEYGRLVSLTELITDPTDQEKVLIGEIGGGSAATEKKEEGSLIPDSEADYEPVIDMDWIESCKAEFARVFPASTFVKKADRKNEYEKYIGILHDLDAVAEENKDKEFKNYNDDEVLLDDLVSITYWEDNKRHAHLEEVWDDFYEKKIGSYEDALKLSLFMVFPDDPEVDALFNPTLEELLGNDYIQCFSLEHSEVVRKVISFLEEKYRDDELLRKLAAAAVYYLLYENKNPIIYRYTEKNKYTGIVTNHHRSIFDHFTLRNIMEGFYYNEHKFSLTPEEFIRVFPLKYAANIKAELDSEANQSFRYTGYRSNHYFVKAPGIQDYIRAYEAGLISEDFFKKMLWDERWMKDSVEILSDYVKCIRDKGRSVANRTRSYTSNRPDDQLLYNDDEKRNERLTEIINKVYDDIASRIVEAELVRGEMVSPYSKYVSHLNRIYGTDYFVRLMVALGNSKFDRSMYGHYGDNPDRAEALSMLLAVCIPKDGENADTLRTLLKGTRITEKKLLETALYAPEWIEVVGDYLGWNGFLSGSYYFMAHMNEHFDEKRAAMIAKFTPLSPSALHNGAFDSNWFKDAYEGLGEEHFKLLYDACKYITSGSKHTRARKYADAALGRMDIEETKKEIEAKRNKDYLMALGVIPSQKEEDLRDRYVFIQKFEKESRKFGQMRRASEKLASEIAIDNMAISNGYQDSMRFILRMESKVAEGLLSYFNPVAVEDYRVYLEASDAGKVVLVCEKDGKKLKSVPTKLKKNDYILELTEAKKALSMQFSRGKEMFENAMEEETVFTLGEIRALFGSPVIRPMVGKLIFKLGDEFGLLSDFENKKDEEEVLVAHPYHMYKSGVWHDLQRRIFTEQIIQPFRQVFRELYVKTEEEKDKHRSMRFAGNQVQPRRTVALLKTRRWIAYIEDGLQKVYYKKNIIASIYALADWFSPSDIEAPTLEFVVFYDRKTFEQLKIENVPDILFSEVMRDVDLAVSVAHAGEVDPEFTHSTVEMRKAIAEFTLPLFKLDNVTFTDRLAKIKGTRGEYTVHLGSGVIHLAGGPMINVLPVHSQHRGKLFLPFVDDDPKTAEVISKILLFAQDQKIKDPFILDQL
jgi:hypothetical protein